MTHDRCPQCGFDLRAPIDRVAQLRALCEANDIAVTLAGLVDERDAARLLGKQPGTLRRWRETGREIPHRRIGGPRGRVYYSLEELAKALAGET